MSRDLFSVIKSPENKYCSIKFELLVCLTYTNYLTVQTGFKSFACTEMNLKIKQGGHTVLVIQLLQEMYRSNGHGTSGT